MRGVLTGRAAAAVVSTFLATSAHTGLSADAYADLAKSEALALEPYTDIAGVRTVCFGETKNVQERPYTPEECSQLLVDRVEGYFLPEIRRCTSPRAWNALHQETVDSLVELSWNIGVGGYCGSSVRKRLDAGRGAEACDRILLWNKARVNGALRPVKGLTDRRKREAAKCRSGFAALA